MDQKSNITSKTTANRVTSAKRLAFPFTAIIGQEEMKLALILNVIDPLIGGVMIMGDRGTGKSTTVRALVDLLPEIQVVANDAFNSDPSDPELMGPEVREKLKGRSINIEYIQPISGPFYEFEKQSENFSVLEK